MQASAHMYVSHFSLCLCSALDDPVWRLLRDPGLHLQHVSRAPARPGETVILHEHHHPTPAWARPRGPGGGLLLQIQLETQSQSSQDISRLSQLGLGEINYSDNLVTVY